MRRRLVFEDTDLSSDRFNILWEGFNVGTTGLVGLAQLDLGISVMRKLKEISTVVQGEVRELIRGQGKIELVLEDDQFSMLKQSVLSAPWIPRFAEKARDGIAFMHAAEPYIAPEELDPTGVSRNVGG